MSSLEIVFREILSGVQSSRVYFAGHTRVSASASDIVEAVRAYDGERGLILGVDGSMPIVGDRPLPETVDQLRPLLESLETWGASGLFIRPDATERDVTDLLGALAFPPAPDQDYPLFRGQHVGLLSAAAIGRGGVTQTTEPGEPALDLRWERARHSRESTVCVLERSIEDIREEIGLDVEEVGGAGHELLNLVCRTPDLALSQLSMRGRDEYTFVHTVNVSVYTLAVARHHVRQAETMAALAQAALLHDIGKVAVPREVLYKKGPYTSEEWELMRSHPVRGAEILAATPGVDDLAVMAAFGHHLRHDGSGYPKVGAGMRRHPLVSLLAIADVYEALVAERPYKRPMPPEEAVALIVREAGKQFDATLVGAFVRVIGIFPIGACVRLSDGREGVVTHVNSDALGRPVVRIASEDGDSSPPTAEVIDLSEEAARRAALRIVGTMDRAPRVTELAAVSR